MKVNEIEVSETAVADLCERNHIRKLGLFGSALRGGFTDDSDIDLLVEFEPDHPVGLFGMARMETEFSKLFGRKVDLRTPQELSRHFRQDVIDQAMTLYARG